MTRYHRGEIAAQQRAGVLAEADRLSGMIGGALPPAARGFLAAQPMIVLGAVDAAGEAWASMLTGRPGFVTLTGPSELHIAAHPVPGDPLEPVVVSAARVGLIAIDLENRRRVRMNGTSRPIADGLVVELAEVFPNCPKYIQQRHPEWGEAVDATVRTSSELTTPDLRLVEAADTFFVATADPGGFPDVSHRGGNPGFVRATGSHHLQWPDYAGNSMFATLGNLELDPRAGLLVPDWSTGSLLHLTGNAAVDWDASHAERVPGAERLVDLEVQRVVRVEHATSLRWDAPEFSRFNPPVPVSA